MRLLIISNNSGGLANFRGMLLAELVKQHEVVVLTPIDNRLEELENLGVRVVELPLNRRSTNPFGECSLFLRIKRFIDQIDPDYVITYTIKPNLYAGLICSHKRIQYAVNITGKGTAFERGGFIKSIVTFLYKKALKRAKVVFFENNDDKGFFVNNHIIKKEQCVVLHGAGVDLERFCYQRYPNDIDTTRFLFIGRVMKEKGVDELFGACNLLLENGYAIELHILGRYEEGYQITFDEYSAQNWFHYHGVQDDVRPYIAMCHCFVLPSWHEGMANTNLENAASGRPVITTNIPGCKEAVVDGESGYLCNKKDANSLYETMVRFIKLSPEEKVKMGQIGREHMMRHFNKKDVVKETITHLFY